MPTLTTIRRIKPPKRAKTDLQRIQDKARRQKHENRFEFLWKAICGPPLKREHRFDEKRKWRFDFAHHDTQVAIEIEGGMWTKSRHTNGAGYSQDCEKYNAATLQGWRIFRLTPDMITAINLQYIKGYIEGILIARDH